jgi:tRNA-modifying protein YgfZ
VAAHDLRTRAGAVLVPWAVVRVHGPEAASYLQGQLSQDVTMPVGDTRWTFLLQPSGKVEAWLRVTRVADAEFLLDAPCTDPGAIIARLERFKLRTEVELEVLDRRVCSHRGPGVREQVAAPGTGDGLVLPAGWPGVEGVDVVAHPDGPPGIGTTDLLEAWHALRIECGVPLNGAELGPDTIPAEAGAWVIDASVSFAKGCYTGQELVARIDTRGGNVPRPIRAIVVNGAEQPPVGATVEHDGRRVGELTSVATSPALGAVALGPVARSVPADSDVAVRWEGGDTRGAVRVPPLR